MESKETQFSGEVLLGNISDNLSEAGWSWGCIATIDSNGRTIWIVAHRDDGERFVVHADEILAAFVELEAVIPSRCFSF